MIQDIAPHVFNNQYKAVKPALTDTALTYKKGLGLVKKDGGHIEMPTFALWGDKAEDALEAAIYLFSVDDKPYFLVPQVDGLMFEDDQLPEGYEYCGVHQVYEADEIYIPLVEATGNHLNTWYRDTQYCGRCGKKMTHHPSLRAMKCECGNLQFPRIAPVVLAAIIKDDKIVATRYKDRPFKGLALNAGFVEIGESLEEAIRREVEEEVGLKVAKIHYYGSQPWGHTGIVMAGYFVEIEGDDTITIDEDELSEAFWCPRSELPEMEYTWALTATMFEAFRKKEFHLFE